MRFVEPIALPDDAELGTLREAVAQLGEMFRNLNTRCPRS
jgi:hypothetical protein